MSTMGARMGLAAMASLGVTKSEQFQVEGHCYSKNCALDGVQYTTGCTLGNGNLSFGDDGKAAFSLKKRGGRGGVLVSVSEGAMARLSDFKGKKGRLTDEKAACGPVRALEIDAEIEREFAQLVLWVQSARDAELFTITRL